MALRGSETTESFRIKVGLMSNKKEKIVSFESINRKEYIVDTVTGIMVAGILICVLRGATHFIIQWICDVLCGDGWQFYARTLCSALVSALSLSLPVFIYGLAVDSKLKTVFAKKSSVPVAQKALFGALGAAASVAAALVFLKASFFAMDVASLSGYEFTVAVPDIGATAVENAFYVIVYALVPALVCEPLYRGVIMNRLSKDSYLLAVLIPAVIFAANHPTIPQIPYMLAVGVVLGWTYLKTEDIRISILIHALTNAVIAYLYVKAGSVEAFTLDEISGVFLVGLILIFAGVMVIFAFSRLRHPEQESKPFSIKESLRGLFGTFGIYVLIIVVMFQLGAWHIDNTTFEIKGSEENKGHSQTQQYDEDETSEQDNINE